MSFSVPLDHVDESLGAIEFILGSHLWDAWYQPIQGDEEGRLKRTHAPHPGFIVQPDFEAERGRHEILSYDMEPGDVLAFHGMLVHAGTANTTGTKTRRALHRALRERERALLRHLGHSRVATSACSIRTCGPATPSTATCSRSSTGSDAGAGAVAGARPSGGRFARSFAGPMPACSESSRTRAGGSLRDGSLDNRSPPGILPEAGVPNHAQGERNDERFPIPDRPEALGPGGPAVPVRNRRP